MNYKYFKEKIDAYLFYAKDESGNFYYFEKFSFVPQIWIKATWKKDINHVQNKIRYSTQGTPISEFELKSFGIPPITPKAVQNQLPYAYHQDYEEKGIFYAYDENERIYIYRNPNDPEVARICEGKPSLGQWEEVTDPIFNLYCHSNIHRLSKSSPRSAEQLKKLGIPLIDKNKVVPCTINHLYP